MLCVCVTLFVNLSRILHGGQCLILGVVWCNLPGWRWATINKVALDRLSRSMHSDVCDSDGCCNAVLHSRISGCGCRRFRAAPNNNVRLVFNFCLRTIICNLYSFSIPREWCKECPMRRCALCSFSSGRF